MLLSVFLAAAVGLQRFGALLEITVSPEGTITHCEAIDMVPSTDDKNVREFADLVCTDLLLEKVDPRLDASGRALAFKTHLDLRIPIPAPGTPIPIPRLKLMPRSSAQSPVR